MIALAPLALALLSALPAPALPSPVAPAAVPSTSVACCAPQRARGQQYEMTVEDLGGGCFNLHYAGSNVGVYMGWDGILMVDTGFLSGAPEIEQKLIELWDGWWETQVGVLQAEAQASGIEAVIPPKPEYLPLRYVLVTHFHDDHVGANAYFGLAGAQIVSHETVRPRLLGDESIGDKKVSNPPMLPEGVPTITFEDDLTIWFNGGPVEIVHLPMAHSDGDVLVYVRDANVAFTGDLYNSKSFPYIELMVGARPKQLIEAHEAVLAMLPEDARIAPGHGVAGGTEDLREFADMFADCDRQMRAMVADGKNTMELYNLKLFGEYEDRWAEGMSGRVRGFIQIMWFCYAPTSQRGLGELDRERAELEAAGEGEGAGPAAEPAEAPGDADSAGE